MTIECTEQAGKRVARSQRHHRRPLRGPGPAGEDDASGRASLTVGATSSLRIADA